MLLNIWDTYRLVAHYKAKEMPYVMKLIIHRDYDMLKLIRLRVLLEGSVTEMTYMSSLVEIIYINVMFRLRQKVGKGQAVSRLQVSGNDCCNDNERTSFVVFCETFPKRVKYSFQTREFFCIVGIL